MAPLRMRLSMYLSVRCRFLQLIMTAFLVVWSFGILLLHSRNRNFVSMQRMSNTFLLESLNTFQVKSRNIDTVFDKSKDIPHHHTCFDGTRNITIRKTPMFVIIGSQKSGTSSLFHYLLQHPNILPTKFFDWNFFPNGNPIRSFLNVTKRQLQNTYDEEQDCQVRQLYTSHFLADGSGNISFEKTPSYLVVPHVAPVMKRIVPWVKVIAILRNPVDRAYSHYCFEYIQKYRKTGERLQNFETAIKKEIDQLRLTGFYPTMSNKTLQEDEEKYFDTLIQARGLSLNNTYLLRGLYAIQLRKWMRYFPYPESLLVLKYEDLENRPQYVYTRILQHVGLPDHAMPGKFQAHNTLKDWYIPMKNRTRTMMADLFEPYNAQLADLLGEDWRGVWS